MTVGIDRRADESVSFIEALRPSRNGMDQNCPDAGNLRCLDGS